MKLFLPCFIFHLVHIIFPHTTRFCFLSCPQDCKLYKGVSLDSFFHCWIQISWTLKYKGHMQQWTQTATYIYICLMNESLCIWLMVQLLKIMKHICSTSPWPRDLKGNRTCWDQAHSEFVTLKPKLIPGYSVDRYVIFLNSPIVDIWAWMIQTLGNALREIMGFFYLCVSTCK